MLVMAYRRAKKERSKHWLGHHRRKRPACLRLSCHMNQKYTRLGFWPRHTEHPCSKRRKRALCYKATVTATSFIRMMGVYYVRGRFDTLARPPVSPLPSPVQASLLKHSTPRNSLDHPFLHFLLSTKTRRPRD